MTEKLLVPDIGDFENVEVIEILVKEGQEIEKNDPVVTFFFVRAIWTKILVAFFLPMKWTLRA